MKTKGDLMLELEVFEKILNEQSKRNDSIYGPNWRYNFNVNGMPVNHALLALKYISIISSNLSAGFDIKNLQSELTQAFQHMVTIYLQHMSTLPVMIYTAKISQKDILTNLLHIQRSLIEVAIHIESYHNENPYFVIEKSGEDIDHLIALFLGIIDSTIGVNSFMKTFLN